MTRGILLVACGDCEAFARLAVASIKRVSGLPVHLHCDPSKPGLQSRLVKLRMHELSPFDETLFLDCDTLVMADPLPLFSLLQHAPLWMALDVGPRTVSEVLEHRFFKRMTSPRAIQALRALAKRRPHAPHFNSGVVLFNKSVAPFFDAWRRTWAMLPPGQDQVALMLASDATKQRPALLSPHWNFQHSWSKPESDLTACREDIRILHLAGRDKPMLYRRAKAAGYW